VPLDVHGSQAASDAHGYAAYGVGFIAVEWLVQQRGAAAVLDFYREVGAGKSWQDAFAQVFGRSIDQFYVDFTAYRGVSLSPSSRRSRPDYRDTQPG
jgi:hypothetical protein